jgi:hypothetical protein
MLFVIDGTLLAFDLFKVRYANASQVPRKLAATEELQPRNLLLIHSAAGNLLAFSTPQADALFLEDKDKAFARYEYVFSILSFQSLIKEVLVRFPQPLLQKSAWIEERAEIFEPMKLLKQRLERFDVVLSAYDIILGDDALRVIREYGLMLESFRLDMREMEGWVDMNPACRVVAIHDSFQNVGLGGKLASERDILDWIAQFKGDKTGFEPPSDIAESRLFHRWDGALEGKEDYDEETASRAGKTEMWRVHDKYAEIMYASKFPPGAIAEINCSIDKQMEVVPRIEYKYKYPGLPGSEPAKVKYFYAP